jgi:hypothetical protein
MSSLVALGRFLYDFVIGDDWRVAVGVVVAGAVTALLAAEGVPAWWFPPLAVVAILYMSLRRAARS